MFALSYFLFAFVCLAQSRRYYYYGQGAGFCSGKSNGHYEDPDNCYGFITCSNGRTFKMKCPSGLKYNKKTDECDWPQNVQCGQEAECKIKTTNGGCCSLPFTYKWKKYYSCTKANHNKPWCSLDPVYKGRWGNCVDCREGSTQFDQCGQRCKCIGGRLVQCVRIRKEFTSLSPIEKKRHIDAIIKYTTDPKYRSEYEDFINEHYILFPTLIHEKQHFLPWHRYYVLRYENLIRKVDCAFTVAWWDWSLDTREPFSTTNPDDVWHYLGYGGNGEGKDHCVQTGPFRQAVWSRVRPSSAGPGPHCLVRDFYGDPPEEVDVEVVLKNDSFHFFEDTLRLVLHNGVHCNINGTMCTRESASAPEFFLHHGFVDKIWDDWQKKSHKNKYAYFPSIKENMPGTKLKPSKLIDLSKQPGGIRVEYEPFQREVNLVDKIIGDSVAELRKIRRRTFQGLSKKGIKLFKLTKNEVKRVREIEKWIDPNVIETKD